MLVSIKYKRHGGRYAEACLVPFDRIQLVNAETGEVLFMDGDNPQRGKISAKEIARITGDYLPVPQGMTWRGKPVAFLKAYGETCNQHFAVGVLEGEMMVVESVYQVSRDAWDELQNEPDFSDDPDLEAAVAAATSPKPAKNNAG